MYATWPKNLKIIKINLYIPSPSAEVVEKLWSAPASVTPPPTTHPSLALGQAVSLSPSSSALTTHPPVLPGSPVHSQFLWSCRVLAGHPWLRGGERGQEWAEGRLACRSGPPTYRPDPRGARGDPCRSFPPHEVTRQHLSPSSSVSRSAPLGAVPAGRRWFSPRRSSQWGNRVLPNSSIWAAHPLCPPKS